MCLQATPLVHAWQYAMPGLLVDECTRIQQRRAIRMLDLMSCQATLCTLIHAWQHAMPDLFMNARARSGAAPSGCWI